MRNTLTLAAGLIVLAAPAAAQTELSLWYHGAGSANAEERLVNELVAEFNASQSDYVVTLETFPQLAYNDAVGGGGAGQRAARHPGRRRPGHAQLGLGRLYAALGLDAGKLEGFLPGPIGTWNARSTPSVCGTRPSP